MIASKILAYFLAGIFIVNLAYAANIHGTVYDLSLKKMNNALVEINTTPQQQIVTQNGSYAFIVANGAYTIKAQLVQRNTVIASVQENITVKQDGSYVLDLILFPDVEEGVEDIDFDVDGDIIDTNDNFNTIWLVVTAFIVAIVIVSLYYFSKKKKKQKEHAKVEDKAEEHKLEEKPQAKEDFENNDLKQVIEIIRKEGGRTTQKDIRKQIPLSEAKISLMITELEHKGVIEKIKKGRGNIIILKRK